MSELLIIAAIALVVIGPEKFPEFAKIALRAYRDLRGYVDDIKREMAEEMKPVHKELRELSRFKPEDYIDNVAKAVAAFDAPAKKEEQASDATPPPGDWSGGASETPAHTEPASDHPAETPAHTEPAPEHPYETAAHAEPAPEHHAETPAHADPAPQHHAEGESDPAKDNIYG